MATRRIGTGPLEAALVGLIEDCAVWGLNAQHDERDLFDGP